MIFLFLCYKKQIPATKMNLKKLKQNFFTGLPLKLYFLCEPWLSIIQPLRSAHSFFYVKYFCVRNCTQELTQIGGNLSCRVLKGV